MSTPGYGATARILSPTSGREWIGEVLVWGPHREPFLRDAETAEVRWFPASWVKDVADGPENYTAGECGGCVFPTVDEEAHGLLPYSHPACPQHGDPEVVASNILKRARSRA